MEREPTSNIRFFCSEHLPAIDPALKSKPLKEFVGNYVKLAFEVLPQVIKELLELPDEAINDLHLPKYEHLWVEVTELTEDGQLLIGELINHPEFAIDWECGDELEFSTEEVEDIRNK